eukprot:1146917-Pelagomonas_calceolata.AAC.2
MCYTRALCLAGLVRRGLEPQAALTGLEQLLSTYHLKQAHACVTHARSALQVLCAEALNRKLLASLEQLSTNPPPKPKLPLAVPAPAATLAQPPQPHSSAQQTLLPRPSMHARLVKGLWISAFSAR